MLSPILFAIIISYLIDGLAFEAKLVLGLSVWMAIWWATEAIPFYAKQVSEPLRIHSKRYFLNIIHILVPTKISTARTINTGIMICPISIN